MNEKYEMFIKKTEEILEQYFLKDSYYFDDKVELDGEKLVRANIKQYIEDLKDYLLEDNQNIPTLKYDAALLKNEWIGLAFNLDFEMQEFNKIVSIFSDQYHEGNMIMRMNQKDIVHLQSILKNMPIDKDDVVAMDNFNDTFDSLEERIFEDRHEPLKFENESLISALESYCKKYEKFLNNPEVFIKIKVGQNLYNSDYEYCSFEETIFDHLRELIPQERLHRFAPYFSFLPKAKKNVELFEEMDNAIISLKINKNALVGKYKKIITESNINRVLDNIVEICNTKGLNGISSIEKNLEANQSKDHVNNVVLLFVAKDSIGPTKTEVQQFFIEILNYYHDNYKVDLNLSKNEQEELYKIISKTWLDIRLPQKTNINNKLKL